MGQENTDEVWKNDRYQKLGGHVGTTERQRRNKHLGPSSPGHSLRC